jgi:hypothetical protein
MSGTRKLAKFDLGRPAAFESGTRRLDKFDIQRPTPLSISTPVAEISAADLAAARPSLVPGEEAVIVAPEPVPVPVPVPAPAAVAAPAPQAEQLRTRLARRFTTLADEVTEAFGELQIGAGWWVVELTAPGGMSTGGGKQMLQYLRLRPKRHGHVVLVGGVVNSITKTADLRDHAHMDTIYRARFGRALEITAAEWEQFLRRAELVLRHKEIRTARVAAPRELRAWDPRTDPGARRRMTAAIAFGVVTAAAAIVVWRVFVTLWP